MKPPRCEPLRERIQVECTATQRKRWRAAADTSGVSFALYVRCALDQAADDAEAEDRRREACA